MSYAFDLSEREREVIRLVALGYTAKQISTDLGISSRTVEAHKATISSKIKGNGIAAMTRYAIRNGILSYMEL